MHALQNKTLHYWHWIGLITIYEHIKQVSWVRYYISLFLEKINYVDSSLLGYSSNGFSYFNKEFKIFLTRYFYYTLYYDYESIEYWTSIFLLSIY